MRKSSPVMNPFFLIGWTANTQKKLIIGEENMNKLFQTALIGLALSLSAGAASATTLGPITFDNDAFADDVAVADGMPFNTDFSGLLGSSNQTVADIGTSNNSPTLEIIFTDNVVVNGAGADIFVYAPGEVAAVVAGLTAGSFGLGTSVQASSFTPSSELFFDNAPLNPFFFNPNSFLFAIDLDSFGLAAGAEISSFFLQRGDIEGGIYGVGAANSRSVVMPPPPPPSAVPLPAAGWLLVGTFGCLGLLRRRRG